MLFYLLLEPFDTSKLHLSSDLQFLQREREREREKERERERERERKRERERERERERLLFLQTITRKRK